MSGLSKENSINQFKALHFGNSANENGDKALFGSHSIKKTLKSTHCNQRNPLMKEHVYQDMHIVSLANKKDKKREPLLKRIEQFFKQIGCFLKRIERKIQKEFSRFDEMLYGM